jgi:hypothetical protein
VFVNKIYENPAEYPAIYGGDECGAGVRGMQSPSSPLRCPAIHGGELHFSINIVIESFPAFQNSTIIAVTCKIS